MKRMIALLLAVLLLAGVGTVQAEDYFSEWAIRIGDVILAPEELEEAMNRSLMLSALSAAERGFEYQITDHLNLIDTLDKVMFDLESAAVLRQQAIRLNVWPTEEAYQTADEQGHAQWEAYLEIARSENGMAFLPAGNYETAEDDPEQTLLNYLASFGLTEDAVCSQYRDRLLDQYLKEAVTVLMTDATEDELIDYYTDWFIARFDETEIVENGLAVAEVVLRLVP